MKIVILAGGYGTRLMEETEDRPKPMVEVGGKPMLWHIMKIFKEYGFDDFIICLGYKSSFIKKYFLNYYLHNSDITIELDKNKVTVHASNTDSFKITLIDTGLSTNTAGRIKKIQQYTEGKTFMLTYGDGVANINLKELVDSHKASGKLVTLTSVQVPSRFKNIEMENFGVVTSFKEKPKEDEMWINGGFFVMEQGIFEYLKGDMDGVQWEKKPLIEIAKNGELNAYKHFGFWKCMDAVRDRTELEELWNSGDAAWKTW